MGNAPFLDMSLPYAAGSLYSTVEDLYKWDQALYTDKLLPANLKQKIFTPSLQHYGYGWFIDQVASPDPGTGQTIIEHTGGINGFNTLEQRLVSDHDLILVFSNTPGSDLDEMAKGIRAILYGEEPKLPKRLLVSTLGDTLVQHGVEAAVTQYRELKHTDPDGYNFAEERLNSLGYMLLRRDRISDAITIFKLGRSMREERPETARHRQLSQGSRTRSQESECKG